jgi:hypothetical protein
VEVQEEDEQEVVTVNKLTVFVVHPDSISIAIIGQACGYFGVLFDGFAEQRKVSVDGLRRLTVHTGVVITVQENTAGQ